MYDLVDFEDLDQLDGGDLRAVFELISDDKALDALRGTATGLRERLMLKLSRDLAIKLEAGIAREAGVSPEASRAAQRDVIDVLCRLSRGGIVAFDDPEDMVA